MSEKEKEREKKEEEIEEIRGRYSPDYYGCVFEGRDEALCEVLYG